MHRVSQLVWLAVIFTAFLGSSVFAALAGGGEVHPARVRIRLDDDRIRTLDFDSYLAAVVASEVPSNWPLEALRAQAVVARSYALARITEQAGARYDLEADHRDQMFSRRPTARARQAVRDTAGLVLHRPSGEVLKAYYHADCGGETVPAPGIWGPEAYDAGTARDPWCATRAENRWVFESDRKEFFDRLGLKDAPGFQFSRFRHKPQGIPLGNELFSVQQLRSLFGFFKIRSSIDRVEINGEKVRFSGRGFGHGAGLCQWGTLAQVRAGRSFRQVLRHYYPRAVLWENRQNGPVFGRRQLSKSGSSTISK